MTRRARAMLIAVILVLSSCGDVTPESLAFATTSTEPTVVRLASPRIAGFEDVIADWEREHPTVEVEISVRNSDDHHRSIIEDAGAGGTFDLVAFDAAFGPEIREHPELFVDINTRELAPEPSDYLSALWDEGVAESGELIGVPLDVDSTALLVRTDVVDRAIIEQLKEASTWCDILVAGDAFSDETNTAFFPDTDDLVHAILSQSRTSFVSATGILEPDDAAELEWAWDLAMIALGEGPLHGEPCDNVEGVQRIARNLQFDTAEWRSDLRDTDFAAVIAPWSFRQRIVNAAPETAGDWTTIGLPDAEFADGTASEGGLHLAIPANAPNAALAYDLLLTLTNESIQEIALGGGTGPLPAAFGPHVNGAVTSTEDGFFIDNSGPLSSYSEAALDRPAELAEPQRRVVIEAITSALNRVEGRGQTPDEAWTTMLEDISDTLS